MKKYYVETVVHPEDKELYYDIYKTNEDVYFFEYDGDHYDKTWCKNPLEECRRDALQSLKNIYNGNNFDDTKYIQTQERQAFEFGNRYF